MASEGNFHPLHPFFCQSKELVGSNHYFVEGFHMPDEPIGEAYQLNLTISYLELYI